MYYIHSRYACSYTGLYFSLSANPPKLANNETACAPNVNINSGTFVITAKTADRLYFLNHNYD